MGRRSSDSDDDRRKKSKSSRRRDRRSRSRERRKRSRSRDRKRSRSRSSSYEEYRRSRSSRKDRRYSRSSSSRSSSSSSSDSEKRRSKKDKKTSSSQSSKDKTKQKMKKALAKAESKDEVLKRDKAVKEFRQLAPDKEAILQIESNEFVPQSFRSSADSRQQQVDGKDIDSSHEAAMFGAGGTVPETSSSTAVPDVKTTPLPVVTQSVDKEGLFASWLHEDEETKTARWITKLKKMRQELLAAT